MATSLKFDFPIPGNYGHDLQSGDLLFPKNPNNKVVALIPAEQVLSQFGAQQRQKDEKLQLRSVMSSDEAQDKQLKAYLRVLESQMARAFGLDFSGPLGKLNLPLLIYLYRLLFADLSDQIEPFLKNINLTFGHVAMVFEESGEWYVAEAGCTDYSHYRVSIAPYFDPSDVGRTDGPMRGWAARRTALGQCTWTARHTLLDPVKFPNQLTIIVNEFKNWLNVPYGILEPGMMENPDRMYCSEVLARSFEKAAMYMDENQSWEWVLAQIAGLHDPQAEMTLKPIIESIFSKFPLLSPKMIYKSSQMKQVFSPTDAKGNVLTYA